MTPDSRETHQSGKVAIIGMACLFPGAPDLASFWSNIVRGADAIRDVSDSEWCLDDYYDPAARSFGRSYSKRGGFISDLADFDPLKYGVMPNAVAGTDPDQLLTLKVAYDAMADAGYLDKPFDRDTAEIILGRIAAPGLGSMNLIQQGKTVQEISQIVRNLLPDHDPAIVDKVEEELSRRLVSCNSDNIPGTMPNVLAGRIAAKLGFRGRNLLIDAACASSMVAVETAVNDLLSHKCNFALAGGLHVNSSAVFYLLFCGLGALSRKDQIRPFDETADGTLLGEGIGILCLKRYEDAVNDGDRIYATICGVASSSDGYGGSVISPSLDGEALALEKAYKMAGISPSTIGLLEAHGTGTPTGDVVEMQAVARAFHAVDDERPKEPWCAVGSVKSMIGHCQSASAVAGIIKTALSLYHKILPPTLNVSKGNPKIDWENHPCYINTVSRPWINTEFTGHPRRAAVSAFGFGGINGHMVMEESEQEMANASLMRDWDSEIFVASASTREELETWLTDLSLFIGNKPNVALKNLAYTLNRKECRNPDHGFRLALVASTLDELGQRADALLKHLKSNQSNKLNEPEKGLYYTSPGTTLGGKLAFLYPGLGSAYSGMLADLCMHFPEVREVFEIVDTVAALAGASTPPSSIIFPRPALGKRAGTDSLATADFAVVAVLLAEYALYQLLHHLDIKPDVLMGCSTGEFAAMTTGGAVNVLEQAETFYRFSTDVARTLSKGDASDLQSLRVFATKQAVLKHAGDEIHLGAVLADKHCIVTGSSQAIAAFSQRLTSEKIAFQVLPAAIPYHTPLVKDLIDAESDVVTSVDIKPLTVPTWSCSNASAYSEDGEAIRKSFTELFTKPVELYDTICGMYDDGVRKFIEVGPNGVLTTLVDGMLSEKPHLSVATNLASKPALTQMHHMLAALFVEGVEANFEFLYQRRLPELLDLNQHELSSQSKSKQSLNLCFTKLEVSKEIAVDRPATKTGSGTNGNHSPTQVGKQDVVPLNPKAPVQGEKLPDAIMGGNQQPAPLSSDDVVSSFLNTTASFYNQMAITQANILTAFFASESETIPPVVEETHLPFLFLHRFQSLSTGGTTELLLPVDLQQDLYLLDHAIGGSVATGLQESRVYLMPLMVSIEIAAEAAFAHAGGGCVRRIEQIKAFRRIVVDRQGLVLRLVATERDGVVHVEMFETNDSVNPVLVANVVLENSYAQPSPPEIQVTGGPARLLKTRAQLYSPSAMFHGPRMQAVQSIEAIGDKCIEGFADSRKATNWLSDVPVARSLVHPMLLDNSSQFVLFYLYEKGMPATALLPFFIESIDFFGPLDDITGGAYVRASLQALSDRMTEARVEIFDGNNCLRARINSINSKRVILAQEWIDIVARPVDVYLSKNMDVAAELKNLCFMNVVERNSLPQEEATLDWCLDYVLTKQELTFFRQTLKFEKRRTDWLLGRIAAKDAVRRLLANRCNLAVGPLDFEIAYDERRRPLVRFNSAQIPPVLVSISHTSEIGTALASLACDGNPGIDIEGIASRDAEVAREFLTAAELDYLKACDKTENAKQVTRLWSAKEAVYKSLGGTKELTSFGADIATLSSDVVGIGAASGESYKVYCHLSGELVTSYTLGQQS